MDQGLRYLLAVDGGGLRGVIAAAALAKLEEDTGRPARETFSFVAGTSTGAIIAAGIAAGVPMTEVVRLYMEGTVQAIDERWWTWPLRQARFYLHAGWHQDSHALLGLLEGALGDRRQMTLNDSPIDIMLTAKHVASGETWRLTNDPSPLPPQRISTGSLSLARCAVASAAEPMFFSPFELNDAPGHHDARIPAGVFVDGGLGLATNPVYAACLEAFEERGEHYVPAQTVVVSLGTGSGRERGKPRGLEPWIRWSFRELMDAGVAQQVQLVRRYIQPRAFYRIDVDLGRVLRRDRLASLPALRAWGAQLADAVDWPRILAGEDGPFRVPAWSKTTAFA